MRVLDSSQCTHYFDARDIHIISCDYFRLERANSDMLSFVKYISIWFFNYNILFHAKRSHIVGTTRFAGLQYRRNTGAVGAPLYTRWESLHRD